MLSEIKKYRIVKSRKLARSRQVLSPIQHRIMLLACAKLKPEQEEFEWQEITAKEIFGGKLPRGEQYDQIKKAALGMMELYVYMKEGSSWEGIHLLKAKGNDNDSSVYIKFYEEARPLLINIIGAYNKYRLDNVFSFKSSYSYSMYDLLLSHAYPNGKAEFELSHLKEVLGVIDLISKKDKYAKFSAFEAYVLQKSKEEINKFSDIRVKYEKVKKGRSIHSIRYTIDTSLRDQEAEVVETIASGTNKQEAPITDDTTQLKQNLANKLAEKPGVKNKKAYAESLMKNESFAKDQIEQLLQRKVQQQNQEDAKRQAELLEMRKLEFNNYAHKVRNKYFSEVDVSTYLHQYIDTLKEHPNRILIKPQLDRWTENKPSESDLYGFGTYLIKTIGTPEENKYLDFNSWVKDHFQ